MQHKLLFFLFFLPLLWSCTGQTRPDTLSKPAWDMGVALYSFNRFPFAESLDKADSAGVVYVEGFDFHDLGAGFSGKTIPELSEDELKTLKKFLDEKGLAMPSLYVSAAGSTEDWVRYFELGNQLGLQFFVSEPDPIYWDLLDSLAERYEIQVAIHQHAKGESRYWHPDSVLVALEGRPNLGACADLGHWVRSGLDPVSALQTLAGRIISVHAKDLDEAGQIKANDVRIGSGVIDYPAVFNELGKQQFDGPIYIECEHNWLNNLADVAFGVRYLDSLAATPGQ